MMRKSVTTVAVLIGLFLATSPAASEESLKASFDTDLGQNFYSVQFPETLGGEMFDMEIVGGNIDLAIDFENGTVEVKEWTQEIEPLLIYGVSTGNIRVELDDTKAAVGTYDSSTGAVDFELNISLAFDGDLSQLGFTSPVQMTAVEHGTIAVSGETGGLYLFVDGNGAFGGGEFGYTCQTTAEFEVNPELSQPADVNRDREINLTDAISALGYLFMAEEVSCPNAIDVNGDDEANITDVIYTLNSLYRGAGPIPASLIACQ